MFKTVVCLFIFIFSGCATIKKLFTEDVALSLRERHQQMLKVYELDFAQKRFERCATDFKAFQQLYPQSEYLLASQIGEAQCLDGLGKYEQSQFIYLNVIEKSAAYFPEITAVATYNLSFIYERNQQDTKALALLLESRKVLHLLPDESAKAQIPARIAMLYSKEGNAKESVKYVLEADHQLKSLMEKWDLKQRAEFAPELYYKLGKTFVGELTELNFKSYLAALIPAQQYQIKAMQYAQSPFAEKAFEYFRLNHELIWSIASQQSRQKQIEFASLYQDLLDAADIYRPESLSEGNHLTKVFSIVDQQNKAVKKMIYQIYEKLPLTQDSLNKLKNLKNETNQNFHYVPSQNKLYPDEDPNL